MSPDASGSSLLEVPPGWDCVPLDQLVAPARGISYGIVQPGTHDPGGVPIVRVTDVRNGQVDTRDVLRVAHHIESAYERTRLRGGEVLLSLVGTLGETAIASERLRGWNVARAIGVIPVAAGTDAQWVELCLRSSPMQALMRAWATTTVQATLNLREVRRLPILMPPEGLRARITETVGALDDKIEQNCRTAQALERLARATFRAWFVDFEPVKAKVAGATAFSSMPQPVFDALPTRFVDSAIGPVPEGWEISTVGNCASYLSRGITPRYMEDVGVLVLNQKCIRHFAIDYRKARRHDSSARRIDAREVKVGDVLINSTGVGTLGRLAQVLHLPETAVVDTHITVVRPSSRISMSYFGQALTSMQPHIESLGEGSTGQTELNRRKISELTLLVPTTQLMEAYQDFASPIMKLVSQTRREDSRLIDLRDYLLPKLLFGQLRVEVE